LPWMHRGLFMSHANQPAWRAIWIGLPTLATAYRVFNRSTCFPKPKKSRRWSCCKKVNTRITCNRNTGH